MHAGAATAGIAVMHHPFVAAGVAQDIDRRHLKSQGGLKPFDFIMAKEARDEINDDKAFAASF